MKHARGLISIVLLLLANAAPARGDLSLGVEVGWSGQFRAGRWGPLFVTVADSTPRPVTLEVYSPHANGFGMHTRLALSVSPAPTTYAVYVPLAHPASDLTVVVRDARTQRKLGEWPSFDERAATFAQANAAGVLVGTSGRAPTMRGITGATRAGDVAVVFVDPLKLPASPAGYDAFDVLVLNRPDLARLGDEQHQAVADWVRAGGNLVIWPGEDPIPPASPLVGALPVVIGDNVTLETDAVLLERHGLPDRFAKMRGRALLPKPGATRVPTFGDAGPDAWRGRCGFGQVLVVPFDPTFFTFRDDAALKSFWQPVLEGFIDLRAPEADTNANYNAWNNPSRQRRSAALQRASNELLGNVPGIGEFGFTYVAVVMIGLMVIVGPVDWLVLRYLGRQPWTWVTTSGWVALVTVGALFIGHLFKSGELHFRTLRVIDQADGAVVGATDFVGVYAPRTRVYEIVASDREGWWQPGADIAYGYGGGSMRTDVPFAQDAVSNRLLPMIINVWNLRFLQGEALAGGPPVIEAELAWAKVDPKDPRSQNKVVGSITNRGSVPLRDVIVRVSGGALKLSGDAIAPGETVRVDEAFQFTDLPFKVNVQRQGRRETNVYYGVVEGENRYLSPSEYPAANLEWYWSFFELSADRSHQLDEMFTRRVDAACVYAEFVDPQPAVTITDPTAKQEHWQCVRALVPIRVENGESR